MFILSPAFYPTIEPTPFTPFILFLRTVSSIISNVLSWVGSVFSFIKSEPIILLPFICFIFVSGSISLVLRLMK